MEFTSYIGIAAGIFTSISLLPQLIKIIREKETENISSFMLIILITGLGLWIWYGLLKKDYPILITNSFSFLVNSLVIYYTFRYKKKK
jgi:MtN3 and saliva related transmembrane protein